MIPKEILDAARPTAEAALKQLEGCKLTAYQDNGGRWTIGYGATGPGIAAGVEWSQQEADERLEQDLEHFLQGVSNLVKAPVTANQTAALTSFAFNLGLFNLKRSGLLKKLNLRDYRGAADQFPLWNHIGLYADPGLTKRRAFERDLFLKGQ